MLGLPSVPPSLDPPRRRWRKLTKAVMRSHHIHIPVYDMPIRIRPWFVAITCGVMLTLALLHFTSALSLNDKLLHFVRLTLATGVFYFIWDVEEDARRIWVWRHAAFILTGTICFFMGGIVSEIVQSLLPDKTFDIGDVLANILGSGVGLYVAYHLERYYRHRREISRLYQPLDNDDDADDELLPTHYQHPHTPAPLSQNGHPKSTAPRDPLRNVWDEREDVFDIGAESDEEDVGMPTPKIIVTPGSA